VPAAHGVICSNEPQGKLLGQCRRRKFNTTIKTELIHREIWDTRKIVRAAVYEYIEAWYNRKRLHGTLGYRNPATFEQDQLSVA
jgi:transposase InsO family protein